MRNTIYDICNNFSIICISANEKCSATYSASKWATYRLRID